MPLLLEERVVGDFVVKYRQRLPGEDYQTLYAVTTYERGTFRDEVVHLHDCFGYGDDRVHMDRKFLSVVRTVGEHQGI